MTERPSQDPLSPDQSEMIKNWMELSAWAETCEFCTVKATTRAMPFGRTVVEIEHEPGCPEATD